MTPNAALRLLTGIAALDADMPLQQARCLFILALHEEGLSLTDLAQQAGIGLATASRYVGALGKSDRHHREGLKLVESFEDPMERRKKIIRLTAKGRAAIRSIVIDAASS